MNEEYRKQARSVIKEAGWTAKSIFKITIPLIILVILLGGIIWIIRVGSQPARVVGKVLNADSILYNYEWFKQTYQDVKAIGLKIKNAEGQIRRFKEAAGSRDAWTFEDKNEFARLSSIFLGLSNQKEDIVATYNARAKMASRGIFMTGELPKELR